MKKLIMCGAMALSMAFAVSAFAAPAVPADGIVMDNTKLPVTFNHSTHGDYKCGECHHPVDGAETFLACGSAGCHDNFDKKDKSVHGYYNVMHGKKLKFDSCLSCHLEVAGKDAAKKKEMTGCKKSACHP